MKQRKYTQFKEREPQIAEELDTFIIATTKTSGIKWEWRR